MQKQLKHERGAECLGYAKANNCHAGGDNYSGTAPHTTVGSRGGGSSRGGRVEALPSSVSGSFSWNSERIAHERGLAGHSDADVVLHALTDALLGACGAGDIGDHFPPSDSRWRGAASSGFVAHAAALVAARGGRIDHVDVTIICEAPRIGPHKEAIRVNIARLLQLPAARVSIKATTTERLGFTGRGEGIAAQAIATVRLPEEK